MFGSAGALVVMGTVWAAPRLPRWAWLERLGDASYAIYLFHLFVVTALVQAWSRVPDLHGPVAAMGFVAACLVLSSLAGLVLLDRMEQPLQRRLNDLFRVSKRPPAGTRP